VRVDPAFYRPADVEILIGNNAKAKRVLGWTPATPFPDMVTAMVKSDSAN
jgi:GDPmannose 4,6-dehydratase